ncbi:MAG TPA: hypothetical protein EYG76_00155 [Methanothermococcus okinawensis]|uniref:Uncharacterized protein n=1 Tax=Methanothermococcus okinawensis TaxID=155863 RepID=A0A833DR32_9EURY|nr:hypothetical protein [Methanothermococcus okinawensis]
MEIKELMNLILDGYCGEDKKYKRIVYFISNFTSAIVFFIIHLIYNYYSGIVALMFISILIILLGAILIIRRRKLGIDTYSYFNKFMSEIVCYGLVCIVISSISVFFIYPSLLGVFIGSIYGLLMTVEGVLFKSFIRKFGGLLLIFSTLIMIIYLDYQFLILGIVQMIIAILNLLNIEK